jgi:hypothetical protein
MDTQTTPIYQQYLDVSPPQRFAVTVQAYIDYLIQTDSTWSGRRLMREAGLSHNYLSSFKKKLEQYANYKPSVNTIDPIIAVLNRYLPSEQRWPRDEALVAANVDREDVEEQHVSLYDERNRNVAPLADDTFPQFPVWMALPVLHMEKMQKSGVHQAADPRSVLRLSSNMALVQDAVPGYTPQRKGDWAIIQSPVATMPQGVNAWALIRDGAVLHAVPQHEARRRHVVAWIIGTLCLDPA